MKQLSKVYTVKRGSFASFSFSKLYPFSGGSRCPEFPKSPSKLFSVHLQTHIYICRNVEFSFGLHGSILCVFLCSFLQLQNMYWRYVNVNLLFNSIPLCGYMPSFNYSATECHRLFTFLTIIDNVSVHGHVYLFLCSGTSYFYRIITRSRIAKLKDMYM